MRFKKEFSEAAVAHVGNAPVKCVLRDCVNKIGGMGRFVKPTDMVFIKPNLTAGMPTESGGTTDVLFAEAVVELVKEIGPARIIVGECSGNDSRSLESLTNLGYVDMCRRQGVEMVDLDFAEFEEVTIENPLYKEKLKLPKIFLESDVYISLPVLKNHLACGITVALKNSFGLVPDETKLYAHRDSAIEKILVDIASVKPAGLVFMDGRIGAEGIAGGNDFDHPIHSNLVMVTDDLVAADAVSAHLMMQNPRVKYVQWAGERGIGNDRLDFIMMRGLSIEEARVKFMTPEEQIAKDSGGKARVHDLCACTRCRTVAGGALSRYTHNPAALLANVEAVVGPGEWEGFENRQAEVGTKTLLLGDCVQEKYRCAGKWIGGCPANTEEYFDTLASYDIVCTKCEQAVKKVVDEMGEEALADFRILASSKTVFKGKNNNAANDDFLLAVGKCQEGYVWGHRRRIHKNTELDADNYVVLQHGCPVSEGGVREGIQALIEKQRVQKEKLG